MSVFTMDGRTYDVYVTELKRKFAVEDTEQTKRVRSGRMYRDIIGTFYNYSMTVRARAGSSGLKELWRDVSKPVASHVCTFPYDDGVLTQEMYITGGEQGLERITNGVNRWGELQLSFIAMEPKVVPQ